ncbi:hypothetical protein [Ferrimicrobium sp.]|uniref:hypothetical protein n=1 Tax=Ferrimicrobium sp. TaxID=2926050 RepID=UPI002601FC37|nr:hypothetical protein [Ferrimicrobium sp.]
MPSWQKSDVGRRVVESVGADPTTMQAGVRLTCAGIMGWLLLAGGESERKESVSRTVACNQAAGSYLA